MSDELFSISQVLQATDHIGQADVVLITDTLNFYGSALNLNGCVFLRHLKVFGIEPMHEEIFSISSICGTVIKIKKLR